MSVRDHMECNRFISIKGEYLSSWADEMKARELFGVLIRRLINSTLQQVKRIDFPAYEDSQRPGWDGNVQVENGNAWVPDGLSGWEFGVNKNIRQKAEKDYQKSIGENEESIRKKMTFVFVSLRSWSGKKKWIEEKNKKNEWKEVRAYDSSDLEQWIEQSIPVQVWLRRELNLPNDGVDGLDFVWNKIAKSTRPELKLKIFNEHVERLSPKIKNFFLSENKGLIIHVNSKEEGLSFLYACFDEIERQKSLVVENVQAYRDLIRCYGNNDFYIVVCDEDVRKEIVLSRCDLKYIILTTNKITNDETDISLGDISDKVIFEALLNEGMDFSQVKQLIHSSGGSFSVLRRLLSIDESLKKPKWADSRDNNEKIIHFALIGSFSGEDKLAWKYLERLSNSSSFELQKRFNELINEPDSPVWKCDLYYGVTSKFEALKFSSSYLSQKELDVFLDIAKEVLTEDNPILDLNDEERIYSAYKVSKRKNSDQLRRGIAETLALFSQYGDILFSSVTVDIKDRLDSLMGEIFRDLNARKLEGLSDVLDLLVAVSPDVYINKLFDVVRYNKKEIEVLFRSVKSPLCSCPRGPVMESLDKLGKDKKYFAEVFSILVGLSDIKIEDNYYLKPKGLIRQMLNISCPRTNASEKDLIRAACMLFNKRGGLAWNNFINDFREAAFIDVIPCKMENRRDKDRVFVKNIYTEYRKAVLELILSRERYDLRMLSDLISILGKLEPNWIVRYSTFLMNRIEERRESDLGILMKSIRNLRHTLTFVKNTPNDLEECLCNIERSIYDADFLIECREIFSRDYYFTLHQELSLTGKTDLIDELITKKRISAINDLYEKGGKESLLKLSSSSDTAYYLGYYFLTITCLSASDIRGMLVEFLSTGADLSFFKGFLVSFYKDEEFELVLRMLINHARVADLLTLFLLIIPFDKKSWLEVEKLDTSSQTDYWDNVTPMFYSGMAKDTIEYAVDKMILCNRGASAFNGLSYMLEELKPSLLLKLLKSIPLQKDSVNFVNSWDVCKAIDLMRISNEVSFEDILSVEFLYMDIKNCKSDNEKESFIELERFLFNSPNTFVLCLVATYRRDDEGEDPEGYKLTNENLINNLQKLLFSINCIPDIESIDFNNKYSVKKLEHWINYVREKGRELSRENIFDYKIGELLANSPVDENGNWPNNVISQIVETLDSEYLNQGIFIGRLNLRGIHMLTGDGCQEKKIADQYDQWADAKKFEAPVVYKLLKQIQRHYEKEASDNDRKGKLLKRFI